MLYKEELKTHLNSDDGERNLAFFLPEQHYAPEKELDDNDTARAKRRLMKVGVCGLGV